MNMTKQEFALINFIRVLAFDDLLDATEGILIAARNCNASAKKAKATKEYFNAAGFNKRIQILEQLAELLGDSNLDYRNHINPESMTDQIIHPSVIHMNHSETAEIIHLFNIMKKYNVPCSLEFNHTDSADPLIGISSFPVDVEFFEGDGGGDALIVKLGEVDFSFAVTHDLFKHITDHQIDICICNDHYSAWFVSGAIPPEGIEEARNYVAAFNDLDDQEIHLNALSEDFIDCTKLLANLLEEGRVIKNAVVMGDGNQVLTVGFYQKDLTSGLYAEDRVH